GPLPRGPPAAPRAPHDRPRRDGPHLPAVPRGVGRAGVNVLMVTPHLPPHLLGQALAARGHTARFLTWGADGGRPDTAYVRRRAARLRRTRLPQALEAAETWWKAAPLVRLSEVAHIHSS